MSHMEEKRSGARSPHSAAIPCSPPEPFSSRDLCLPACWLMAASKVSRDCNLIVGQGAKALDTGLLMVSLGTNEATIFEVQETAALLSLFLTDLAFGKCEGQGTRIPKCEDPPLLHYCRMNFNSINLRNFY